MELEKLKYPIGKFEPPQNISKQDLTNWIHELEILPEKLTQEVQHLSDEQLDTPYRSEGWTIRQVVHHLADSHMNVHIRTKLALTEEKPIVKPYFETLWAELADSKNHPIEPSLKILEGVHRRLSALLKSLSEEGLKRTFIHPEHGKEFPLREVIAMYAWHGNHHLAHITTLKKHKGW
ncbi:MAG: bacillithiol transferase BstA [Flavobacteriaceae bacterium]|jgi:uncharacterized damage-inducible protein DinB|nr:bacillithiol transferase BstA [Flavobacteriaceae bacterium]